MIKYQLTSNPDIIIADGTTSIPKGHRWWDDYELWLAAGNTPTPYEEPAPTQPSIAELQAQVSAIQQQIDSLSNQQP